MKIKLKIIIYIKAYKLGNGYLPYRVPYFNLKRRLPAYKINKYRLKHLTTRKTLHEPVIFTILT